jgi:hypothetical protein
VYWRWCTLRAGKTRSLARKMGVKKVGHCGTLDPMATVGIVGKGGGGWGWGWGVGRLSVSFSSLIAEVVS